MIRGGRPDSEDSLDRYDDVEGGRRLSSHGQKCLAPLPSLREHGGLHNLEALDVELVVRDRRLETVEELGGTVLGKDRHAAEEVEGEDYLLVAELFDTNLREVQDAGGGLVDGADHGPAHLEDHAGNRVVGEGRHGRVDLDLFEDHDH